jgi:hypothetical protein
VRAAAAMLWPASTSRTASSLNSSVYFARGVVFVISVLLASIESLSKGDVFCGQGHYSLSIVGAEVARVKHQRQQVKRAHVPFGDCLYPSLVSERLYKVDRLTRRIPAGLRFCAFQVEDHSTK